MTKDTSKPAFPVPETKIDDCCLAACYQGMTLRQWYAGMALQGLLACSKFPFVGMEMSVKQAFELADAMLKEGGG